MRYFIQSQGRSTLCYCVRVFFFATKTDEYEEKKLSDCALEI
jgi:hypothetical protein